LNVSQDVYNGLTGLKDKDLVNIFPSDEVVLLGDEHSKDVGRGNTLRGGRAIRGQEHSKDAQSHVWMRQNSSF
jgi:hypothetical protein